MKTLITNIFILTMTVTAITTSRATSKNNLITPSSEHTAREILAALRSNTSDEYVALYPTLEEFHHMMTANAHVYGEFLNDAKRDFADDYVTGQLPALREAFDKIVTEGKQRNIDWKTIQYVGIEMEEKETWDLKPVPFTIVFLSNGKKYRLCLQKAFVLNGQWKVSSELVLL